MEKFYSYDKVVDTILSPTRLYTFNRVANARSGLSLSVVARDTDSCYTHKDYWEGITISLGRNFYKSAYNLDDQIPVLEIKERYKHMSQTYVGVFYHELGHILYTDMSYLFDLLHCLDKGFRDFAMTVCNILEDITIEESVKRLYSFTSDYFDVLNSMHFIDSTIEDVSNKILSDPDSPGTFLSFLLLLSRGYDVSLLPKYELFENNLMFIKWGAVECINTINAKLRHRRQVAYAQQLCKILDLKEPDVEAVSEGVIDPNFKPSKEFDSKTGASKILDSFKKLSNDGEERYNHDIKRDAESNLVDSDLKEHKAQRSNPEDLSQDEKDAYGNTDLTREAIIMIANDEPVLKASHKSARLDDYCSTARYIKEYNYYVDKHFKEINSIVSQIRKMKAHNNSSVSHYRLSGRFDLSTCYKKDNYKIFKQRKDPSHEADLVVEILVDNSGSMSGNKSKLAGEALIIFCEALNRLHIPFAVDAFTEGNSCVTIKLKEFNDDFNKVKTNMTLLTEQFSCYDLHTFCSNVDEVNLRFVRDILNKQPQKDKMCIVISDGATCGDWRTLRKIAKNMEKSGILMLGIGIFDNNVTRIYDNHIVLKTTEDLQKLAGFLHKYLVSHIFK